VAQNRKNDDVVEVGVGLKANLHGRVAGAPGRAAASF
jgi:hypothetical protein